MPSTIRVRLAPSPTGDVHIGTVWLAQFDWLFAKQQGGKFIVRIEDTDQKRFVEGSIEKIYDALNWYGLTPDEGPEQGGPFGPYVQSQRLELYQKYARQLIEQGKAYYCFCSSERLDEVRLAQQAAKLPPRYDKHCANLDRVESSQRAAKGEPHVIRLNMPLTGIVTFHDLIRGDVTFGYDQVDDSVILKSDGFPTYHLAVVVDDHLMEISHVIRGEEWLSSAPKHLYLYECFGWTPPIFAHLPLILGTDKKKLSKRHGAMSALSFRDLGYLPEAMQNFLALMGWHPKGDAETLTRAEVVEQFNLEDVNPSGAVFDQTKLDWLNGWYIRQLPIPELVTRLRPWWNFPADADIDQVWLEKIVTIVRDRLTTLKQIDEMSLFFWPSVWDAEVTSFDRSVLIPKKGSAEATAHHLRMTAQWLNEYQGGWTAPELKEAIMRAIADAGKKNGEILWPLRVALSLRSASPDVFDLLAVMGREESIRRVNVFQ